MPCLLFRISLGTNTIHLDEYMIVIAQVKVKYGLIMHEKADVFSQPKGE